jgi:DNA-binding NtrC family response regulator
LKEKGYVEPDDLGLTSQQNAIPLTVPTFDDNLPLKDYLKEVEKKKILDTLERNNWKRNKTSEALGISRITLYSKMKEYEIGNLGK